ncbi:MAG: hypothetical protein AB7P03_22300 [Kofleriaceae bacterium]
MRTTTNTTTAGTTQATPFEHLACTRITGQLWQAAFGRRAWGVHGCACPVCSGDGVASEARMIESALAEQQPPATSRTA